MKICNRCGYQNTDDSKKCLNCLVDLYWARVNLGKFTGNLDDTKRIGEEERKRHGIESEHNEPIHSVYMSKPPHFRRWRILNTTLLLFAFFAPWEINWYSGETTSGFKLMPFTISLLIYILINVIVIFSRTSISLKTNLLLISFGISIIYQIGILLLSTCRVAPGGMGCFIDLLDLDEFAWGYWLTLLTLVSCGILEILEIIKLKIQRNRGDEDTPKLL